MLFKPVFGQATSTPINQVWTRLTYDIKGDISLIEYVAPNGKVVNGKGGYASIAISQTEGGGTHIVYKNAVGKVVREQ